MHYTIRIMFTYIVLLVVFVGANSKSHIETSPNKERNLGAEDYIKRLEKNWSAADSDNNANKNVQNIETFPTVQNNAHTDNKESTTVSYDMHNTNVKKNLPEETKHSHKIPDIDSEADIELFVKSSIKPTKKLESKNLTDQVVEELHSEPSAPSREKIIEQEVPRQQEKNVQSGVSRQDERVHEPEIAHQQEKNFEPEISRQKEKLRDSVVENQQEKIVESNVSRQEEKIRKPVVENQQKKNVESNVSRQEEKIREPVADNQQEKFVESNVSRQEEKIREPVVAHQQEKIVESSVSRQEEKTPEPVVAHQQKKNVESEVSRQEEKVREPVVENEQEKIVESNLFRQEEKLREPVVAHQQKKNVESEVSRQEEKVREPVVENQQEKIVDSNVSRQKEKIREPVVVHQQEKFVESEVSRQEEKAREPVVVHQQEKNVESEVSRQEEKARGPAVAHQKEKNVESEVSRQEEKVREPVVAHQQEKNDQSGVSSQEEKVREPVVAHQQEKNVQSGVSSQDEKVHEPEIARQQEKNVQSGVSSQDEKVHEPEIARQQEKNVASEIKNNVVKTDIREDVITEVEKPHDDLLNDKIKLQNTNESIFENEHVKEFSQTVNGTRAPDNKINSSISGSKNLNQESLEKNSIPKDNNTHEESLGTKINHKRSLVKILTAGFPNYLTNRFKKLTTLMLFYIFEGTSILSKKYQLDTSESYPSLLLLSTSIGLAYIIIFAALFSWNGGRDIILKRMDGLLLKLEHRFDVAEKRNASVQERLIKIENNIVKIVDEEERIRAIIDFLGSSVAEVIKERTQLISELEYYTEQPSSDEIQSSLGPVENLDPLMNNNNNNVILEQPGYTQNIESEQQIQNMTQRQNQYMSQRPSQNINQPQESWMQTTNSPTQISQQVNSELQVQQQYQPTTSSVYTSKLSSNGSNYCTTTGNQPIIYNINQQNDHKLPEPSNVTSHTSVANHQLRNFSETDITHTMNRPVERKTPILQPVSNNVQNNISSHDTKLLQQSNVSHSSIKPPQTTSNNDAFVSTVPILQQTGVSSSQIKSPTINESTIESQQQSSGSDFYDKSQLDNQNSHAQKIIGDSKYDQKQQLNDLNFVPQQHFTKPNFSTSQQKFNDQNLETQQQFNDKSFEVQQIFNDQSFEAQQQFSDPTFGTQPQFSDPNFGASQNFNDQKFGIHQESNPQTFSTQNDMVGSNYSFQQLNYPTLNTPPETKDSIVVDHQISNDIDVSAKQPNQPTFGVEQQSTFSVEQQPTFGVEQQPTFGVEQQPTFSIEQQPTFGIEQQPTFGVEQQSNDQNFNFQQYNGQSYDPPQQYNIQGFNTHQHPSKSDFSLQHRMNDMNFKGQQFNDANLSKTQPQCNTSFVDQQQTNDSNFGLQQKMNDPNYGVTQQFNVPNSTTRQHISDAKSAVQSLENTNCESRSAVLEQGFETTPPQMIGYGGLTKPTGIPQVFNPPLTNYYAPQKSLDINPPGIPNENKVTMPPVATRPAFGRTVPNRANFPPRKAPPPLTGITSPWG